ncbi:Uncharacterized protein BM_BM2780 [Brugia malayi]|uniref:Bm2780, isoform d n=1 Tax=Brugia malayi TaxID=6279 RepID=A0A1U7F219_BRUMA|nr:Uncharacterized protein BM_BM2780 [Brugia malayi]CDQ00162.1 Bm2780, isoform d [Brugia malayi]VIO91411.1 Uncharacterized protein BM_BM2780 [Brugia malayi]
MSMKRKKLGEDWDDIDIDEEDEGQVEEHLVEERSRLKLVLKELMKPCDV